MPPPRGRAGNPPPVKGIERGLSAHTPFKKRKCRSLQAYIARTEKKRTRKRERRQVQRDLRTPYFTTSGTEAWANLGPNKRKTTAPFALQTETTITTVPNTRTQTLNDDNIMNSNKCSRQSNFPNTVSANLANTHTPPTVSFGRSRRFTFFDYHSSLERNKIYRTRTPIKQYGISHKGRVPLKIWSINLCHLYYL